jgi:hypothetical protein
MSTQTALGQSFPTPCKRCGGALYRQIDHCPYCGTAHPLDTDAHPRAINASSRPSAANQAAAKLDTRPALSERADMTALTGQPARASRGELALRRAMVSSDAAYPSLEEPPYATGGSRVTVRRVMLASAVVVVIGLGFVAHALFSDNGDQEESSADQAEASINQDARSTTGTIAPLAPDQSGHLSGTIKAAPDASTLTANSAKANAAKQAVAAAPVAAIAPVAPVTPVAPPVIIVPPRPAAPQFHDVSQALQAAHSAFNANDLSTAQAALTSAQTLQPGNSEAQTMASELRPLTARRDTALQAAQACVAQQSWACARQHANDALKLDTSNETAKAILQRAIRETGWAPLKLDGSVGASAQVKPTAQALASTGAQQAPAPTSASKGDANNVDARERSIVDSGWSRATANGNGAKAAASPGQ